MTYKPRNVRKMIRLSEIESDESGRVHFVVPARSFVVRFDDETVVGMPGMHIAGKRSPALVQIDAYAPADCPLCDSVTEATTASAIAQGLRNVSTENAVRLGRLAHVTSELAELDRERAALVASRDEIVRSLWPDIGATTLARVVALTVGAIYKIVHRDSNRAVTQSEGPTAHEPSNRRSNGTP